MNVVDDRARTWEIFDILKDGFSNYKCIWKRKGVIHMVTSASVSLKWNRLLWQNVRGFICISAMNK